MNQNQNQTINVHSHFQGKFNTSTGRLIDLIDPSPESLHIDDISRALSRICRFGGHSSAFYSVAQHSVLVASIVSPSAAPYALMHDASEAFLGDVIKPLKVLLEPHYRLVEERFELAILKQFQIVCTPRIKAEVKDADMYMLELEHEALILGKPTRLVGLMNEKQLIIEDYWAWDMKQSKQMFNKNYKQLFEI